MKSRRRVSNIIISVLLRKVRFSYVRVSLKRDEYYIYMAKLSLQSLYWSDTHICFSKHLLIAYVCLLNSIKNVDALNYPLHLIS